jgi:hypothetical protein
MGYLNDRDLSKEEVSLLGHAMVDLLNSARITVTEKPGGLAEVSLDRPFVLPAANAERLARLQQEAPTARSLPVVP